MQRYSEQAQQAGSEPVRKIGGGDTAVLMIKNYAFLFLSKWPWFVLSLGIALAVAVYKLKSTPPVYMRTVSILIKTNDMPNESLLETFDITAVPSNITNEMEMMKTGLIATEVARRLNLNVEYSQKGTFHDVLLYGLASPVKVTFAELPENDFASFTLDMDANGWLTMTDIAHNETHFDKKITAAPKDTIATPLGKIVFELTEPRKEKKNIRLQVTHKNMAEVVNAVQEKIKPTLHQKGSTIIDISYKDVSPTRAEEVLNTLVGIYNEKWIKDRNLKTSNTDKFIKERLAFIEQELGDVEEIISLWKSQNLMLNVDAAGSYAQSQVNEADGTLKNLNDQMYMTRYIRDYLTDGKHTSQLLPANSGITNANIEKLIGDYNSKLLVRNNHLANSSIQNPLVKDLDEDLAVIRGSILQSLDYEITMLQTKANSVRSQRNQAVSQVASNPGKAQQLLTVERQQKVKEELYLYLLKRREENELSQAFEAYNNQLIETPRGPAAPVSPNQNQVLLIAIALGLLIPGLFVTGIELLNTKVRGRKDIEGLSAPYAGDIPLYIKKGQKKQKTDKTSEILVVEKKRDIINEAFRVIRTNLEFLLGFNHLHQIVMLTSVNPGSGKTFITANLASALAIKDKKVLAIDLDLRKGSLSNYVGSPKHGVSNYLSGQEEDYRNLIVESGRLHILPCGSIPPNPAELLFSPRFKKMIEEVKGEYDYVFLDCPPVEVVADASIISPYSDLTLFVIRVGHIERDNLPEVEEWYHNKKFGNLAILLNGIEYVKGRYGYHKYGYHYGTYGYGYGEK